MILDSTSLIICNYHMIKGILKGGCVTFSLLLLDKLKPGCYAISVSGQLPHHVIRDLKMKGIQYKSRDVSSRT